VFYRKKFDEILGNFNRIIIRKIAKNGLNSNHTICETFEESALKLFDHACDVKYSDEYIECNLNANSKHVFLKIEENELINIWNCTLSDHIGYIK
jgi:hypothetical protein